MTKSKIFKVKPSDIREVWNVISACSKWLHESGMDHWKEWYTEERVKSYLESMDGYAMREEGVIVGTIFYSSKPSLYFYDNDEDENHVLKFKDSVADAYYLHALAVHPKYQGRGYAKSLIAKVEQTTKRDGVKYIRFDVRGDYAKLVELYKKLDYKIVGSFPDPDSRYFLFEKEVF